MEVENGVAVESDLLRRIDQKLDRVLVVEDHLRFEPCLPVRFFADIQEALGFEQRIGVALEAARVPGQVDQQSVQDLPGVGAGGLLGDVRLAGLAELLSLRYREIEGLIGTVSIQKVTVVADGITCLERPADLLANLGAGLGHRRQDFDPGVGHREMPDCRVCRHRDRSWHAVAYRAPRTLHDQALALDQGLDPVLQSPMRRRGLQCIADLLRGHAFRLPPHGSLDRLQVVFLYAPCHVVLPSCAKSSIAQPTAHLRNLRSYAQENTCAKSRELRVERYTLV